MRLGMVDIRCRRIFHDFSLFHDLLLVIERVKYRGNVVWNSGFGFHQIFELVNGLVQILAKYPLKKTPPPQKSGNNENSKTLSLISMIAKYIVYTDPPQIPAILLCSVTPLN